MATKFAEAFVEIGARLDNTQFGRMRQTIGSRMQSIGRSAGMMFGAAMAGAIAVTGVVATISKLTNLARDQLKEERKLEAVLKATGHAAGYSADQLKRMAADLQAVTNFGDETTISAMAVLATFRQIRGDVFREAIESAQDLSAVMGQSLQSSIVMIGKALNSPKESLTALSRAGITFSEQQKEQIKLLQESGDLMGAQRIILAELRSQFGGAARDLVDPLTQLKNTLGDTGEELGKILLPALNDMAIILKDVLPPATKAVVGTFLEMQLAITETIRAAVHGSNRIKEMKADLAEALGMEVDRDAIDFWKIYGEELDRTVGNLRKRLNDLDGGGGGGKGLTGMKASAHEAAGGVNEIADAANAAADAFERMQRAQERLRSEARGVLKGMEDPFQQFGRTQMQLERLRGRGAISGMSQREGMEQAREKLRQLMGVDLKDHLTPIQRLSDRLDDLRRLQGVGALTKAQVDKEYARATKEAMGELGFGDQVKQAAAAKQGASGGFLSTVGIGESIQRTLLENSREKKHERDTARNTAKMVEKMQGMIEGNRKVVDAIKDADFGLLK